ncbi:MAG: NAD(P)H-binding protein [Candidatus Competibacter sp.]|nr:NAD(P)H-binding protein [Candidatus Competibacter sp.]
MYVLLGSNGKITSKIARLLLAQGKSVRVVGRSRQGLDALREAGAEPAVGAVEDVAFLIAAFRGAEAVYTMLPPVYGSSAPLADYTRLGDAIARAVAASGVGRVVNLSSTGAHLPKGTGPIVGLHDQEQRLNALADVKILHLRPGYFFENHFNAIGLIKAHGIYSDLIEPDAPIPSIGTSDIATVAARELVSPGSAAERRVLHLRGPKSYTPTEAAKLLGRAIGQPDLRYVRAEPAQAKAGMVLHGISPPMADLLAEMSEAFARAEFIAESLAGPTETTPTELEQFGPIFKAAYENTAAGQ